MAAAAQPLQQMRLFDDRDGRRGRPKVLNFAQDKSAPLAHNLPNRALAAVQEAALSAAGVDVFLAKKRKGLL